MHKKYADFLTKSINGDAHVMDLVEAWCRMGRNYKQEIQSVKDNFLDDKILDLAVENRNLKRKIKELEQQFDVGVFETEEKTVFDNLTSKILGTSNISETEISGTSENLGTPRVLGTSENSQNSPKFEKTLENVDLAKILEKNCVNKSSLEKSLEQTLENKIQENKILQKQLKIDKLRQIESGDENVLPEYSGLPSLTFQNDLEDLFQNNENKTSLTLDSDEADVISSNRKRQRISPEIDTHSSFFQNDFGLKESYKRTNNVGASGSHAAAAFGDNTEPQKCINCLKTFLNQTTWERHICNPTLSSTTIIPNQNPHHNPTMPLAVYHSNPQTEDTYACHLCVFVSKRLTDLKRHMTMGHSEEMQNEILSGSDSYHRCNLCTYVTKREDVLRRHIQLKHTQERPYACDYCDYRFKLKHHKYAHETRCRKKILESGRAAENLKNLTFLN